jgi:hypothetical protein
MIENYKFKYRSRGKFIFVPNERCERKGRRIIKFFSKRVDFPDYFFHYKLGGHVAALHAHLNNKLFFKIDIQNFFYSIARMRVTRALRNWGYPGAGTLAKWSCVANPGPGPKYVLPIGFVQSPLLASLVLMRSPVAEAIDRARTNGVVISVYLDDFIGSHDNEGALGVAYEDIRASCVKAHLIPNPNKLVPPNTAITAFNCDLTQGSAKLTDDRIARFFSVARSAASQSAFEDYKVRVASANLRTLNSE